jgi:DNA-binding ferritin-like protein (Dps family)
MINVIIDLNYLTAEEQEKIKNDKNYCYFPKRDIILYTDNQKEQLIKDYPSLVKYFNNYESDTLENVLENELFDQTLELVNGFKMDMDSVIEHVSMDIPYFADDMFKSEDPEKFFNDYINTCISHHATIKIIEIIKDLESRKELFFEADFLQMDGTKHYNISAKGKELKVK